MKITIEELEFPSQIKTKLSKMIKTSKINLEFINGKNIIFKNSNLGINEPHKVLISNDKSYLVVLIYEDEDNCYVNDLTNPISFTKLISIVNNME